jgi:hypothetical protein
MGKMQNNFRYFWKISTMQWAWQGIISLHTIIFLEKRMRKLYRRGNELVCCGRNKRKRLRGFSISFCHLF